MITFCLGMWFDQIDPICYPKSISSASRGLPFIVRNLMSNNFHCIWHILQKLENVGDSYLSRVTNVNFFMKMSAKHIFLLMRAANLPIFLCCSLLLYFSATCLSQESYDNKVDKAFWWSLLGLWIKCRFQNSCFFCPTFFFFCILCRKIDFRPLWK